MEEKGLVVNDKKDMVSFLSEQKALGEVFVESGMFKDVKSIAEAQVKIMAGRELGLTPLESMTNVYIVNGKVACQAKVIAGLIKRSEKYGYVVTSLTDEECTITILESDNEIGRSSFTMKDAAKAGLVNKDSWKYYPRNMLYARALSNGAKWYCPDVYSGYIVEELEDEPAKTETVTMKDDVIKTEETIGKEEDNGQTRLQK